MSGAPGSLRRRARTATGAQHRCGLGAGRCARTAGFLADTWSIASGVTFRGVIARDDVATFKHGIELLCELYWAAGAKVVYPPIEGIAELHDGDLQPVRDLDLHAGDMTLLAFHPLGTARADARPGHGVVDENLKVRGTEGLYLSDGSVVPSSIGVNPQITIMALATRLAYHLLGKPAPIDEPEPEKIARPRIRRVHEITA